jgi:hypothetical protein
MYHVLYGIIEYAQKYRFLAPAGRHAIAWGVSPRNRNIVTPSPGGATQPEPEFGTLLLQTRFISHQSRSNCFVPQVSPLRGYFRVSCVSWGSRPRLLHVAPPGLSDELRLSRPSREPFLCTSRIRFRDVRILENLAVLRIFRLAASSRSFYTVGIPLSCGRITMHGRGDGAITV